MKSNEFVFNFAGAKLTGTVEYTDCIFAKG